MDILLVLGFLLPIILPIALYAHEDYSEGQRILLSHTFGE